MFYYIYKQATFLDRKFCWNFLVMIIKDSAAGLYFCNKSFGDVR